MTCTERLVTMRMAASIFAVAIWLTSSHGCTGSASSPSQPSTVQSATASPAPAPPAPGSPVWTKGTFTWTSITASRSMCTELTRQVGLSWPLSLGIQQDAGSVTLLLAEGAPPDPNDPFAEPPEKFVGTRTGDTISATIESPLGAMGCPSDTEPTPEVGGQLTATIQGSQVSGVYTDIYGRGENQVTFTFRFQAGFPLSGSR